MRHTVILLAALLLAGATACSAAESPATAEASTTPPATSAAAPSPSLSVSPECRTWIKAELLDSTEDIDATVGYDACGGLSDEELQAAIDEVTEELSAEITPEVP